MSVQIAAPVTPFLSVLSVGTVTRRDVIAGKEFSIRIRVVDLANLPEGSIACFIVIAAGLSLDGASTVAKADNIAFMGTNTGDLGL